MGRGITVRVDAGRLSTDSTDTLVIMNELGARSFPLYSDSDGLRLKDEEIGTWEEVFAIEASFRNPEIDFGFTVKRMDGSRLFRGRELIHGRLSWAGFAYVLPPEAKTMGYGIELGGKR
jgi:hypothetical protein